VGRLLAAREAPFEVSRQPIRILVKAGASVSPTDGATADALLTNAEAALKSAKSSPETLFFYAPHLNAAIANRVTLENALSRAVEAREFRLLYQPKVDLRTGRITSLEALLYWNASGSGLVSPGRFIHVLEDTGMILAVGSWVVRQALHDLRGLHERSHGRLVTALPSQVLREHSDRRCVGRRRQRKDPEILSLRCVVVVDQETSVG